MKIIEFRVEGTKKMNWKFEIYSSQEQGTCQVSKGLKTKNIQKKINKIWETFCLFGAKEPKRIRTFGNLKKNPEFIANYFSSVMKLVSVSSFFYTRENMSWISSEIFRRLWRPLNGFTVETNKRKFNFVYRRGSSSSEKVLIFISRRFLKNGVGESPGINEKHTYWITWELGRSQVSEEDSRELDI